MAPLVSILIPAYNAEKWIAETIRSAIGQTWPQKEIIVVDDGSSDGTLPTARRFEAEGVRVLRQQNQGAAAARNKALSASRGDYIQWLDADDLLDPHKIAHQMRARDAGTSPLTLLSASFGKFMHRSHRAVFTPTPLWGDLSPSEFMLRKLEHKVHMQTATWLVSRTLTEAAGMWDTRLVYDDDGEYFARVLLASDGTRFVKDARVYYRAVGSTSVSYIGESDQKLDAMWLSMQLHIQYLRRLQDDERARAACISYLRNYIIDVYSRRPDIVEEMREVARELGGTVDAPRLSWKYAWIGSILGWTAGRRAQLTLQSTKASCLRSWDKLLFLIENRRLLESPPAAE